MTALPCEPQRRYTAAEFAALPVDRPARYELLEGLVVVRHSPAPVHLRVIMQLGAQIIPQLPTGVDVLPEIDVHLEPLPDTVRIPDLAIVSTVVFTLDQHLTPSSEVLVAVEILSPGTVRTDTVTKPMEYADAGIPHFWLIDPKAPVTATVYRLVDGEYRESLRAEKVLEIDEPCPLRIDLNALLPPALR